MNNTTQNEIQVDIRWAGDTDLYELAGTNIYYPAYRIYVDSDLLTERTYTRVGQHSYIEELITVKLSPGRHFLKIEKINDPHGLLSAGNVRVDGKIADFEFFV